MAEIPLGEVITAGKFLVNQHPTVVLFNSGASHSFMSPAFASKYDHKVFIVDKGSYSISVARSNISTNQILRDVSILIAGREYNANLVVLLGLEIVEVLTPIPLWLDLG
jgi:hypothetical protein